MQAGTCAHPSPLAPQTGPLPSEATAARLPTAVSQVVLAVLGRKAPRLSSSCELTFSGCLASPGKEQNPVPKQSTLLLGNDMPMMSELRARFNFARLLEL